MARKVARRGDGQFQWNAGGWFGAQVGGSLWMLLLGFTLLGRQPGLGALCLGLALLVNIGGFALWHFRDRLPPYPSIQALFVLVGIATLILLVTFDATAHLALLDPRYRDNPRGLYLVLLMFPGLMLLFHVQDRAGRRK